MSDIEQMITNSLFVRKRNVILHGPGGCGKSHLIKKLYSKCNDLGIYMVLTGTTGVSALNIGGNTLHSWTKIRLGKGSIDYIYDRISNKEEWRNVRILVIDEIGMLGKQTFVLLDNLAKKIRKNNKPFGGIQLLLSGDFLQLPPINDDFVFETKEWNALNLDVFIMETPYRYMSDDSSANIDFFSILLRIRKGVYTDKDKTKLLKCKQRYQDYKSNKIQLKIIPSILYSTKADVESMNREELGKLKSPLVGYECKDVMQFRTLYNEGERKKIIDKMQDMVSKTIDPELELKVGAQVMLTYNLNMANKLINGSRGVVTKCGSEYVDVLFSSGIHRVSYTKREISTKTYMFTRYYIPLILAWALTIHKCQGSTLDSVIADLGSSWLPENMIYVALSRCKNINSIYLKDIDFDRIKCNQKALEYDSKLKKTSRTYLCDKQRLWKLLEPSFSTVDTNSLINFIKNVYTFTKQLVLEKR